VSRFVVAELQPTCHFAMAAMQASSLKMVCNGGSAKKIAGLFLLE